MYSNITRVIFALFIIFNTNIGFTQAIHEDELGLESSVALRQELEEIIFDESGRVDLSKVERFRKRVQKLETEEMTNMVNLRILEGKSSEKSEKKAQEEKKMIAIDYILTNLALLSPRKNRIENSVIAKRVLKVWTALKQDPNVVPLVQVPQMLLIFWPDLLSHLR